MSLSPSPYLTAVAAHQRQHALRREATQWHAAIRAAAAQTPHLEAVQRRPAATASGLARSWLARATRQLAHSHPAHLAPPAPGAEGWSAR
jgi:hypothetical protein